MPHMHNYPLNVSVKRSGLVFVVSTGSILFIILYVLAAWYYPGGSTLNPRATGFNLFTNYWCDLLSEYAKNGQLNPGQPFAITAMLLLCLTIGYFWYVTPGLFGYSKRLRLALQMVGVGSMAVAPFLFTIYHDTVINLAGVMGIFAMLGTITGLYKCRSTFLLQLGLCCVAVCGLNNYVYYTQHFIIYLPIIQKISFLLILIWFNLVSLTVRRNAFIHE